MHLCLVLLCAWVPKAGFKLQIEEIAGVPLD